MAVRNRKWNARLIAVGILCALLASTWGAQAAPLALPPRPTPETPAAPSGGGSPGATIELHVEFGQGQIASWQELWTAVQWQDAKGNWHTVEGWQGGLDTISAGTGIKTWWLLGTELLGKGPFRWLVYQKLGGKLLAASEPFNMPSAENMTLIVPVSLAP